jgi:hypothetical protein
MILEMAIPLDLPAHPNEQDSWKSRNDWRTDRVK